MNPGAETNSVTWPQWRLDKLEVLWREGKSASQIAAILGGGLTRNAVVGKAHRLGLAGRPSPIKREAGTPKPRNTNKGRRLAAVEGHRAVMEARERSEVARAKAPQPAPVAPPAPPPPSPPERISHRTCCWPIGDPREPGFHFCEAKPVLEGRSYCDPHHALAYRKTPPHASAVVPLFNGQTRKWAS